MRIIGFIDHQIQRFSAVVFHIGPGGVEVDIVGNDHPFLQDGGKQQVLRHPSLVGGNDVLEAENVVHGIFEVVIIFAAGIGLVAQHHSGPLVIAHGRSAAVGEQIDVDCFRRQVKDIVAGFPDQMFPLLAGGAANRLHHLDAERFGWKEHTCLLL